jgi:hypothetical protein
MKRVVVSVEGMGRKPWTFLVEKDPGESDDFQTFKLPNGQWRLINKRRIRYMDIMEVP